jgi:hypothetical protein
MKRPNYLRSASFIMLLLTAGMMTLKCRKKKEEPPPAGPAILFTDQEPDKRVFTVRGFTYTNGGFCTDSVAIPNDSTTEFTLDLNQDAKPDFVVSFTHSRKPLGNHCEHTEWQGGLHGLTPGNQVALDPGDRTKPALGLNEGDNISSVLEWGQHGTVSVKIYGIDHLEVTKPFLGVRMPGYYGWVRIDNHSIRGFVVKEWAVATTMNASIKAGQKE